jgi:hypothetical protein
MKRVCQPGNALVFVNAGARAFMVAWTIANCAGAERDLILSQPNDTLAAWNMPNCASLVATTATGRFGSAARALLRAVTALLQLALTPFVMYTCFARWTSGWAAMCLYLGLLAIGPHALVLPLDGAGVLLVGQLKQMWQRALCGDCALLHCLAPRSMLVIGKPWLWQPCGARAADRRRMHAWRAL